MASDDPILSEQIIEESDFLKIGKSFKNLQMLETAVKMCEKEGKVRVILDRESKTPYMIRYYLQNFRPFGRIVMHRVLKSDVDGLHDHPWGFQNYIIRGGYWEVNEEGRFWREPGFSAIRDANYFHRLEVDLEKAGDETWTLFMMGPREKEWGFKHTETGEWIPWYEYLENRKNK